jgi:protein-S-isoprenylcysteine O-methyltransferase Ste14
VGLALNLTTIVMFRRSGQDPRPWRPSPSLLLRGPYKFSRNPMYVSVMLVQAGLGVLLNNLWIVIFVVPAMIIVHFTAVIPEEAYLGQKFGASYQTYKASVRRYL